MWPELIDGLRVPNTYGLSVLIGALVAITLAARRGQLFGFDKTKIWDFCTIIIFCGIFGARLFEVITRWQWYYEPYATDQIGLFDFLVSLVAVWNGGLTFYGGFILSSIAAIYMIWKWGLPLGQFADLIAPSLAIGHAIGRFGCFLQGCCYGDVCEEPWGLVFPDDAPVYHDAHHFISPGTPVHPTQLYESLGLLLIFFILSKLLFMRLRSGVVVFSYLIFYGLLRFVIEFWRIDTQDYELLSYRLHISQWIGLIMIMIGLAGFIFLRGKSAQSSEIGTM